MAVQVAAALNFGKTSNKDPGFGASGPVVVHLLWSARFGSHACYSLPVPGFWQSLQQLGWKALSPLRGLWVRGPHTVTPIGGGGCTGSPQALGSALWREWAELLSVEPGRSCPLGPGPQAFIIPKLKHTKHPYPPKPCYLGSFLKINTNEIIVCYRMSATFHSMSYLRFVMLFCIASCIISFLCIAIYQVPLWIQHNVFGVIVSLGP